MLFFLVRYKKHLIKEKLQSYFFDYTTPYGNLELEVRTQEILIQRDENYLKRIKINYQIFDLTGNKFGDYELALQIQEANFER